MNTHSFMDADKCSSKNKISNDDKEIVHLHLDVSYRQFFLGIQSYSFWCHPDENNFKIIFSFIITKSITHANASTLLEHFKSTSFENKSGNSI